ncbi:MAG: hypothetical protein P1V21_21135 [Rhizobiaceae bacterium]|nr:hypothetical protein [Rhizobiaceae bacterium]
MTATSTPDSRDENTPDLADFLSGLLLGLLVGGLVGISVSPLTGDVLAGLVALLAAFFGLGGKLPGKSPVTRLRLLAFCIGVLAGVPCSILVRTNGWLAPPLDVRIERYTAAGLPEALARDLAIFDQTGLRIGGLAAVPDPKAPQNPGYTFSAGSSVQCSALSDVAFGTTRLRLEAMQGADAPWSQAGQFGLALPEEQQSDFADYVHKLFCDQTE